MGTFLRKWPGSVVVTATVDAGHPGNEVTGEAWSGFPIDVNNAPVTDFRKKRDTVEVLTPGSEMVSLGGCDQESSNIKESSMEEICQSSVNLAQSLFEYRRGFTAVE